MRSIAVTAFALLLAAATVTAECDFTAAVSTCSRTLGGNRTRCEHWKCLAKTCPSEAKLEMAQEVCTSAEAQWLMPSPQNAKLRLKRDGSDLAAAATVGKKKHHHGGKKHHKVGGPKVDSPCGLGKKEWARDDIQAHVHKVAMLVYDKRADETYSEDMNLRWVGIKDHVCPGSVPRYSDCSSTVTWIYWTLFGKGPDFLNGEDWTAGYTGTLTAHGTNIPGFEDQSNMQVGDLCFYFQPISHVAIYVGDGMEVSHGEDPVGFYGYKVTQPLAECRRYL
jgi:hypothetical protein